MRVRTSRAREHGDRDATDDGGGPPPGVKRRRARADTARMLLGFRAPNSLHPADGIPSEAGARSTRRTPRGTRLLLDVLVGATLMVAVHLFLIQVSVVKGHSMEPCLHDGDRLVVDRVSYNLGEVGRGDVVVLRYPRNPAVDFVKRVVGVPGDRVAMRHGALLVNGQVADDYGCIQDVQDLPEMIVPGQHFFVLGDNRPISCDSREFGLVPGELLKGKVRVRFWPLANATVF